jgi:Lysozyme like domain
MTPLQIYETMRRAGFPPVVAVTMTAIALRESAGNPDVINNTPKTGDLSYGLLQINLLGALADRMKSFGITKGEQLLDPATNAHAGFVLWNGKNSNLDVAWYITRDNYRQRYESHLPAAQAAALASSL